MDRRLGETYLALDKTSEKLVVIRKLKGLPRDKRIEGILEELKNCQSSLNVKCFDVFCKGDEYCVCYP